MSVAIAPSDPSVILRSEPALRDIRVRPAEQRAKRRDKSQVQPIMG
jgi:hypothetical protein